MAKAQPRQARTEGFNPVPHTADDTARLLADPTVKAAYDALEDEYTALRAILSARGVAVERKTFTVICDVAQICRRVRQEAGDLVCLTE